MSSYRPTDDVQSGLHVKAPAAPKGPGARQQEASPDAIQTLSLDSELLALAARLHELQREAMKDKSYEKTPIGAEVALFMQKLRWEGASDNTLLSYESTLAKLALDFAHKTLEDLTTESLRRFLDERWGESSSATRRQRLATLKSFLEWAIGEQRGIEQNPLQRVKPPKKRQVERNAYPVDMLDRLATAQVLLRDRIAMRLLGQQGLRADELRRLRMRDFDVGEGTVRIHGKGDTLIISPLASSELVTDLETHVMGRHGDEYLIWAKNHARRPMSRAGQFYWFKDCLKRAELPTTIKMHELRHSAGDNLWRETGNIVLAQQLLRHASPATTAGYLHPRREDLRDALRELYG